jgi:inosine/xanthosine triphosphatase
MKITVGSKNKTKIQSVIDAVMLYPDIFVNPEIIGVDIQVELFGHPKNIKETIEGAIKRAKDAFVNCDYSFGLESGLMEVPYSKTGYMETAACAIFNGKNIYLGLSPSFEWPKEVLKYILDGKGDASEAFKQLGFTKSDKLGAEDGGIIGFLTKGKMPREDYTKYGIIMAITQLEQPHLY